MADRSVYSTLNIDNNQITNVVTEFVSDMSVPTKLKGKIVYDAKKAKVTYYNNTEWKYLEEHQVRDNYDEIIIDGVPHNILVKNIDEDSDIEFEINGNKITYTIKKGVITNQKLANATPGLLSNLNGEEDSYDNPIYNTITTIKKKLEVDKVDNISDYERKIHIDTSDSDNDLAVYYTSDVLLGKTGKILASEHKCGPNFLIKCLYFPDYIDEHKWLKTYATIDYDITEEGDVTWYSNYNFTSTNHAKINILGSLQS